MSLRFGLLIEGLRVGWLGRLLGRDQFSWSSREERALVDPPKRPRDRKPATPPELELVPWSATRLAAIFRDLQNSPNARTLGEARRARQCLSRFWLYAPVDQLEGLYRSPVGQCYRMLLKTSLSGQPLLHEEQQWRDGIARKLSRAMNRPEGVNLLLAAMPYFERGKMRLLNATDLVPQWLIGDYSALFDPGLARLLRRPAGLLGPAGTAAAGRAVPPQPLQARGPVAQAPAAPAAAVPLPVLSQRRGNEALALIQNKEFMGRMNGLINLYTIDPSDGEVKRELIALRRQMGQIWLDLNPSQLQALYQSSFGQLYRTLLGCGFTREELSPDDQQLRAQLARYVSNMAQPRAINALLAALPFFSPGRVQLGGGEQFIPAWLMADIRAFNGQAIGSR